MGWRFKVWCFELEASYLRFARICVLGVESWSLGLICQFRVLCGDFVGANAFVFGKPKDKDQFGS